MVVCTAPLLMRRKHLADRRKRQPRGHFVKRGYIARFCLGGVHWTCHSFQRCTVRCDVPTVVDSLKAHWAHLRCKQLKRERNWCAFNVLCHTSADTAAHTMPAALGNNCARAALLYIFSSKLVLVPTHLTRILTSPNKAMWSMEAVTECWKCPFLVLDNQSPSFERKQCNFLPSCQPPTGLHPFPFFHALVCAGMKPKGR